MTRTLRIAVICLLGFSGGCGEPAPADQPALEICECPDVNDPRVDLIDARGCDLIYDVCDSEERYYHEFWSEDVCGCGCVTDDYAAQAMGTCGFTDPRAE